MNVLSKGWVEGVGGSRCEDETEKERKKEWDKEKFGFHVKKKIFAQKGKFLKISSESQINKISFLVLSKELFLEN